MNKYPVILAGAGIGGKENISLALSKALSHAQVIIYDRLLDPTIIDLAPHAEKIYVGKAAANHAMEQEDIHALLETYYREGKRVLRLKGGDPFVFGRGGEEALYLSKRNIPFRLISGITAGICVPAMAGIPVTHRDLSRSVSFITGHSTRNEEDFRLYGKIPGTLVFYMSLKNASTIARDLLRAGKHPTTPFAVLKETNDGFVNAYYANLQSVAEDGLPEGITSPGLIVVGNVVNLHDDLTPLNHLPLTGRTILLTGTNQDAMADALNDVGARVLRRPMIRIEPVNETYLFDDLKDFSFDTLVFTSKNAVRFFFDSFLSLYDVRKLSDVRIYAIGEKTAKALRAYGIRADGTPDHYDGRYLADYLKEHLGFENRIYYPHADGSDPALGRALKQIAPTVDRILYKTLPPTAPASIPSIPDGVVFLSSSAARNFVAAYGKELLASPIFAIGDTTKQTLVKLGVKEDNIHLGEKATQESLLKSIIKELAHHASTQNSK
ncbi:MAG: uroporphyrinogen-III C-methyltransferase [Peptoniphilus sp.]|nr:uroporphyrinogen-III C-methyltransferase [Peptoniphilus sp.]MDY3117999.1 uroporphyrinogen-III C-methyltransferase [Peptoniphilus sp.]